MGPYFRMKHRAWLHARSLCECSSVVSSLGCSGPIVFKGTFSFQMIGLGQLTGGLRRISPNMLYRIGNVPKNEWVMKKIEFVFLVVISRADAYGEDVEHVVVIDASSMAIKEINSNLIPSKWSRAYYRNASETQAFKEMRTCVASIGMKGRLKKEPPAHTQEDHKPIRKCELLATHRPRSKNLPTICRYRYHTQINTKYHISDVICLYVYLLQFLL